VGELSSFGHSKSDEVCVEPGELAQPVCLEPSFERAFESAVIGRHHCSSTLHFDDFEGDIVK
jgi:hypothetical protein